jgi:phosphonoacetate hydrolase
MDAQIGRMIQLGAVLGITADHGMNQKDTADGQPNVIYLESLLDKQFGKGNKVICPITDPYVVHHGSLGSEVMVYLQDPTQAMEIAEWVFQLEGITEVYDRPTAEKKLELPGDRIGDLIVMSGRDVVIGRIPEYHDLSLIKGGLRSHGGRYEEMVPLVITESLTDEYRAKAAADPRNFDVFDFVCNGICR